MSVTSKKLENGPRCYKCGKKPSKIEILRMKKELSDIYSTHLCNNLNPK